MGSLGCLSAAFDDHAASCVFLARGAGVRTLLLHGGVNVAVVDPGGCLWALSDSEAQWVPGPDRQSCWCACCQLELGKLCPQYAVEGSQHWCPCSASVLSILSKWESKKQHSPFRASVGTRTGVLQVGRTWRRTVGLCGVASEYLPECNHVEHPSPLSSLSYW